MFAFLSIIIDSISMPVDRPRRKIDRDAEPSAEGLNLRIAEAPEETAMGPPDKAGETDRNPMLSWIDKIRNPIFNR